MLPALLRSSALLPRCCAVQAAPSATAVAVAAAAARRRLAGDARDADIDAANSELQDFFGPAPSSTAGGGDRPPSWQLPSPAAAGPRPPAPSDGGGGGPGEAGGSGRLTHVDARGAAAMVDVGGKAAGVRSAAASARVRLGPTAYALVAANAVAKGDVLGVAKLAGIMGAKHTASLIPLCHPLLLDRIDVQARSLGFLFFGRPLGGWDVGGWGA
jgi:hypothetical protein